MSLSKSDLGPVHLPGCRLRLLDRYMFLAAVIAWVRVQERLHPPALPIITSPTVLRALRPEPYRLCFLEVGKHLRED